MAQQKGNDNVDTSRYQAHMQMHSSHITSTPSSPTPIDPTLSATSSSRESSDASTTMRQQGEVADKMIAAAINPGDLLHVLWIDDTPGNNDIFYKRDGADFDPRYYKPK